MKNRSTALTKEERDILVLGGMHINGKQLSNAEIGRMKSYHIHLAVRSSCFSSP